MDGIRTFRAIEIAEAKAYASTGCVAVHLHRIITPRAPKCFVRDVQAGYPIAHVFSADSENLRQLARQCGVRVIVIEHQGTPRQHVDMCGQPLRRLMKLA